MDLAFQVFLAITLTESLRRFFPKIDGWAVVVVVGGISAMAGVQAHSGLLADGFQLPDVTPMVGRSLAVFILAFGGFNAVKRAFKAGKPPELVGEVLELDPIVQTLEATAKLDDESIGKLAKAIREGDLIVPTDASSR